MPITTYERQASFTGYEVANPTAPPAGESLDAEFDAIKTTTDSLEDALEDVRGADGSLANGIVTPDTLSPDVVALLGETGLNPRGTWVTATDYEALDLAKYTTDGNVYVCLTDHTSGTFATDLAAGKWMLFTAGVNSAAIQGYATAAEAAQTAAEAAQAAAEASETAAGASETAAASSASAASTSATTASGHKTSAEAAQTAAEAAQSAAEDAQAAAEAAAASLSIPAGVIVPYGAAAAPTGWLLCYGQAVSRTTYATLFGVIGTTYGVGNGTTTFNVPDLRGRFPLGKDDMGGSAASRVAAATALNGNGGSEYLQNHAHSGASVSITSGAPSAAGDAGAGPGGTSSATHTHTVSGTTGNTGNPTSATVAQMNPYLVISYIIKT